MINRIDMEFPAYKLKDPEKNHYVAKLHEHPLLLKTEAEVWQHFRERECVVDLGCGNGHFLESYLKTAPHFAGLGIDLRYKRLFKTAKKFAETGSRVFYGDVSSFVRKSPSGFWNEVWMMFPDPWPKERHAKHRMINFHFFFHVFRMLKEGGRFCFISDHLPYWDFFLAANSKARLFPVSKSLKGDLFGESHISLFKKHFQAQDTPIYSLEFRKVAPRFKPENEI